MRNLFIFYAAAMMAACSAFSQKAADDLVFVQGGTFKNTNSNYYGKSIFMPGFYIGKYEVSQKEWTGVMGDNPSKFKGDNLPVEMVTWYDCVEYCNKRSLKEGLEPYYSVDKNRKDPNNTNDNDDIKWLVTIHTEANGYRLPTEAEWEYAAGGGQKSENFTYSGANDVDAVAWYWRNAGDTRLTGFWFWNVIKNNNDRTHPVGQKAPNELGLYDMSGNVREWCWDWYGDLENTEIWKVVKSDPGGSKRGSLRVWKGGGWIGEVFCCQPSFRAGYEPYDKAPDQGFRVCRSR